MDSPIRSSSMKDRADLAVTSDPQRSQILLGFVSLFSALGLATASCNLSVAPGPTSPASTEEVVSQAPRTQVQPSPTVAPTSLTPTLTPTVTPLPSPTPTIVAAVPGYVILTDISENDPYYAAVEKLSIYRGAEVVRFEEEVAEAQDALRALSPEFMAVLIRPEQMEEGFAFDVFELAKGLEGGYETDVAYGFITGATAEEAVAYVEKVITYEREATPPNPIARTLWRTGQGSVSGGAEGLANEVTQDAIDLMTELGFQSERVDLDQLTKDEIMDEVENVGLLFLYLHGMPNLVECGLNCEGDAIMTEDTAAMPEVRLVLSSSCYTGSIHTWYSQNMEAPETYEERAAQIDPADSLALGFLRHGALAYIGHMCMWGSNKWPVVLLEAVAENPDLTLGEMMSVWYDNAKGPSIIQESAAQDLVGMDNNRFYYAAMVLYGDPALRLF